MCPKGRVANFFIKVFCFMAQYDSLPIYKKAFDLCLYTKKINYFFVHRKFL
jgi:hypothetical protein